MQVNVYERQLASGKISFYLTYSLAGKQFRPKLDLPKHRPGTKEYRETKRMAKRIAAQTEEHLISKEYGLAQKPHEIGLFDYLSNYRNAYEGKDYRKIDGLVKHLKAMLNKDLPLYRLDEVKCKNVAKQLQKGLSSETARNYFSVLKKALDEAIDNGYLRNNPARRIYIKGETDRYKKDVLTGSEIKKLMQTDCGNDQVKKAFLFGCLTGITLSEIKTLTFSQIKDGYLSYSRHKSQDRQHVRVPLNKHASKILDSEGKPSDLIFPGLPSSNGVNKVLKTWMKHAEIEKHITFYCARHTFGTLQAMNRVNQKIIASNMGHTSTKHTDKYVRATDEAKVRAVDFEL